MEREEIIKHIEDLKSDDVELGIAWAYLKAGCEFSESARSCGTIDLSITHPTFDTFESGEGSATSDFVIPPLVIKADAPISNSPKRFTPSGVKTDYSREELIDICRKAIVPVDRWRNRDTPSAQSCVGECFAKLRAGAEFTVVTQGQNYCVTDEKTIWLEVGEETYYLPQPARLESVNGGDWY